MRISSNLFYDQITRGLKNSLSDLNEANNQLATGKKINKPSDDILGTLKAMDYKLSISQNTQFEQNIAEAGNYLSFEDTVLTQITTILDDLKNLSNQTTGTAAERTVYANQAADLRDILLDLSNTTYLNHSIFSGSQTDSPAFVLNGNLYEYQGDSQQRAVSLSKGIDLSALNIPGKSNDPTVISPFTYLLQGDETTVLADGSIATFSIYSDPDPTHIFQTIQVDIINPNKQPTDPDYADQFTFSNVMDIANLISSAFKNQEVDGTGLANQQVANHRIEALSGSVGKILNQALTAQALVGVQQNQLNTQKTRLDSDILNNQNRLSQTEDADMDQTIITLQKISTTLNALRSTAAKILPQSLFDFLK
jgi:flagellar hook-associated protein 3 FlgL